MDRQLITNARIATSQAVFPGSVLIEGERIAEVYPSGAPLPEGAGIAVLDAKGNYLLPGGVDVHTHFCLELGDVKSSDDFYTGSVAAACGGTTTVINHVPSNLNGKSPLHQVDRFQALARECVVDYGLHAATNRVDAAVLDGMADLCERGVPSIKLYTTYGSKLTDSDILAVMVRARELGMVVCVHCENDAITSMLKTRFIANGNKQACYHALSRPPEAEAEAVWRILMLARAAGEPRVYIVHLSTALGLRAARAAQRDGQRNVFLETCPQYLFLDVERYNDDREGLKYIMSPPLRSREDQTVLWQAVQEGAIDTIATDHCPFFFDPQKLAGAGDFSLCPGGIPGVELRMPLLFSRACGQGEISLRQVVRTCCTRPAKLFGLGDRKGDIKAGMDADLVLFDPARRWRVTYSGLHENTDYTPYEGMELTGKPIMTMLRGRLVVKDGEFVGKVAQGCFLPRGVTS